MSQLVRIGGAGQLEQGASEPDLSSLKAFLRSHDPSDSTVQTLRTMLVRGKLGLFKHGAVLGFYSWEFFNFHPAGSLGRLPAIVGTFAKGKVPDSRASFRSHDVAG